MDLFRVRLNCIDHYQGVPSRFDPKLRRDVSPSEINNEPKVPVIRVFGTTETGQKVCAHVHGAFPYLYIDYNGRVTPDEVGAYIHRLHLSIDHALAVSYRRGSYDRRTRFIARITLVKGVPFYGYHVGYQYYLKIYALDPVVMTRLADLLRQGAIMKRVFQPYEAHLQFIMQWMTDYNLYGCGYIDSRRAYFRGPVPKYEELASLSHLWHDRSIPAEFVISEVKLPRVSHCSLEVDLMVQDILNRQEISQRLLHHDFIERSNPPAPDQKLVHSMSELWRDEAKRRKAKMKVADPGSDAFPPEVLISMSAGPRSSQKRGWVHEEEYMELVHNKIQEERAKSDGSYVSFDTYIKPKPAEDYINTAFESVEDLYPEKLGPILGLKAEETSGLRTEEFVAGNIEVDENRIFNIPEENKLPYDSDDDVLRDIEQSQGKMEVHVAEAPYSPIPLGGRESPTMARTYEPKAELTSNSSSGVASLDTTAERFQDIKMPTPLGESKPASLKRSIPLVPSNERYGKRRKFDFDIAPITHGPATIEPRSIPHNKTLPKFESTTKNENSDTRETDSILSETGPVNFSMLPTVNGLSHTLDMGKKLTRRNAEGGDLDPQPLPNPETADPQETEPRQKLSQCDSSEGQGLKTPLVTKSLSLQTQAKSEAHDVASPSGQQVKFVSSMIWELRNTNWIAQSKSVAAFAKPPPLKETVNPGLHPPVIYQGPYYSNELDVPERPTEWAGKEFKLESLTVPFLPDFDETGSSPASVGEKLAVVYNKLSADNVYERRQQRCSLRVWEIGMPPPAFNDVADWERKETLAKTTSRTLNSKSQAGLQHENCVYSQIEGPTQTNKHGFQYTQPQKPSTSQNNAQYMSIMSLEVHISTRGSLAPNPQEDEIQCVFWSLQLGENHSSSTGTGAASHAGIVVLSEDGQTAKNITKQTPIEVFEESSELDLLVRIVEIVRTYDPDILTGFEVHNCSWGYLIERAKLKYEYNLCEELSRMRTNSHGNSDRDNDKWGFRHTSVIFVTGRHMINIWRAMRNELNLLQYTMENVVFHLLHRRIPHYAWRDLTMWYTSGKFADLAKVIDYYLCRVQLDLAILDQNELITRTSEQARLLGVDFFSVLSRGSQFKVESLMFRIAKPENFVLVSPSRKQVGAQNALECLPLVMEPQSAFYTSPLLVLDFQSLYPSVMIAYNYCYSTFLGRIVNWRGGTGKMGFTEYKRQDRLLELLKDFINISPNGMMYTKPEIRKSLLAKMLGEILETRVMVKSGMKFDVNDKTTQKLLNNRQLALKLIANVTYGYTSASFSGRMPCAEIADSIVQTARETLEKAIALIHSVKRWGAEVVYGDTDSIFIYLKGRTKDQAFDIGNEIAERVTNMNPRPVRLKFEKVYLPCVLLAKKRYVGFQFEKKDQQEPKFDAKGIETVRRDGTPAEQKIEEKALKILFRSADLSQVKDYFQAQCLKIMTGSVSIQDFCFAKEVRLGTYSDKGPPPPGALISIKRMLEDHRVEPQHGERVPYVVITGAPGARLIDRCVAPEDLLQSDHNELDSEYYISKNLIPPLERIFSLVGANVRSWYDEMPKIQRVRRLDVDPQLTGQPADLPFNKKTLESYMKSSSCLVCQDKLETKAAICPTCLGNRPSSLLALQTRLAAMERKNRELENVCRSCSNIPWTDEVRCDSKDCPVFYSRVKEKARLVTERKVAGRLMGRLQGDKDGHEDLECVGRAPTLHPLQTSDATLLAEEDPPLQRASSPTTRVTYFLFIYVLGGLTFLPLLVVALIIHAYLTFPVRETPIEVPGGSGSNALMRDGDQADSVRSASKSLDEKFQSRNSHESDVAAGYFAVCREYVPGGINGKPPERTTPTGSTVVTSPSPSVYQSMYRSIFDRKKDTNPLDIKGTGKPTSKGGNVFYVVLRHQHILLFDTEEQLEVRYVLSLAHHDVSIYGGGEEIPDGELFIKRNAICLTRRADIGEMTPDGTPSKPFYLFTDSLSEKEDFYFALLKNMQRRPEDSSNVPKPLQFDVKHIIELVQRLHSSEENMQIRWFNAILGRIFLGIYKTPDVEAFIRAKITKKISRVKKPAFLSKIVIRNIDMGEGAPYVTNPRLKDLTVDGDCMIEGDVLYTGNFRVEIAATARIELGSRFKAREVDLVLAVTIRRVEGHMLLRIKPPPSNRLWMTFETAPRIDMSIEPIVSSRQITYTLILRQIENRIKEVIAESIVMPFWDDLSFFNTDGKKWRGGIWTDSELSRPSPTLETTIAEDGDVDELEQVEKETSSSLPPMEKSMSTPALESSPHMESFARKTAKSVFNLGPSKRNASSTSVETKSSITSTKPKSIRKHSFASAVVSTDNTNIDALKQDNSSDHSSAASTMAALSAKSPPNSATTSPVGSPSKRSSVLNAKSGSMSPLSSREVDSAECAELEPTICDEPRTAYGEGLKPNQHKGEDTYAESPGSFSDSSHADAIRPSHLSSTSQDANGPLDISEGFEAGASVSRGSTPKRNTLSAVASAAENARKWGLNALQRSRDQTKLPMASEHGSEIPDLTQPMGRGKPLPPPGTPLPPPDRRTKTAPIPVPKRRPLPSPHLARQPSEIKTRSSTSSSISQQAPPLPERHPRNDHAISQEGVLIVAAPDSEPVSPTDDSPKTSPHWEERDNDGGDDDKAGTSLKEGSILRTDTLESPEGLHKPSDRDGSAKSSGS
ncbi:hypothetical protein V490_03531 [Pseudogymnoascus sp. VKM F-3557]|nr:hypothetical protein V490_03531 [Pseudogymnoascus sp. VKM F-3557]